MKLTHTTPYSLSAFCLVQCKPEFIRERTPLQRAIESEHLFTQVEIDNELQLGQDPGEDDRLADEGWAGLGWHGYM